MNRICLPLLLIIPLSFAQCQEKSKETTVATTALPKNELLSPAEFENLMKDERAVILDVRTDGEVARGYIEGATQINYQNSDFRNTLSGLDKDKVYLVYCASGGRSGNTQKLMKSMGFTSVYDLKGGIISWQKEGKQVVK